LVHQSKLFYGWRVVGAVFVLAIFGWGFGFYGPPIFLHAVQDTRGWPLVVISGAVTVHFLFGAIVVANLPRLYRRLGIPAVTKTGAVALAVGVVGWALVREPWQLFIAAMLSGGGWVTMSAAAINAIVSPWFVRTRPAALASAYNGSSVGGVVFSPLWVAAIGFVGFPLAAVILGLAMVAATWVLADVYFSRTPEQLHLAPDGYDEVTTSAHNAISSANRLSGIRLWSDFKFITLTAGMALGLFAQIGLVAHLFSLLVPALGEQFAGLAAAVATASAIAGRTIAVWLMPRGDNRRGIACASYAVQIAGSAAFLLAAGHSIPLLLLGVVLFGAGIGNANSLPPLIAQTEFAEADVARVVPLVIAISQATYAFAPAVFGLIREFASHTESAGAAPAVFAVAAILQGLAIVSLLIGGASWPRSRGG
jgi:Transmembrane secretion effector